MYKFVCNKPASEAIKCYYAPIDAPNTDIYGTV